MKTVDADSAARMAARTVAVMAALLARAGGTITGILKVEIRQFLIYRFLVGRVTLG
jgi:hypothetical protein